MKPGDLVILSDSNQDGQRNGGRIATWALTTAGTSSAAPQYTVTFDNALDWTPDATKTYYFWLQNGENETNTSQRAIKAKVLSWTTEGAVVETAVVINDPNADDITRTELEGMPYVIAESDKELIYRIERIQEGYNPWEYTVTAKRYTQDKWAKIDRGFITAFNFNTEIPDTYTEDA